MFYMYKHILVQEAQELMAANLKPPGSTCDEKNGWFNTGNVSIKLDECKMHSLASARSKLGV